MVSGDTAAPPGWLGGGWVTYGVRLALPSVRAEGLVHLRQHQPVRHPVAQACVRHPLLLRLVVCQGFRLCPLNKLNKFLGFELPHLLPEASCGSLGPHTLLNLLPDPGHPHQPRGPVQLDALQQGALQGVLVREVAGAAAGHHDVDVHHHTEDVGEGEVGHIGFSTIFITEEGAHLPGFDVFLVGLLGFLCVKFIYLIVR